MKTRPILFSGEMVRAILDGRKTVTRRIVKDVDPNWSLQSEPEGEDDGTWYFDMTGLPASYITSSRYGVPGDQLWVKETFGNGWTTKPVEGDKLCYRATPLESQGFQICYKWRPSIHMPRWASRITLEIVSVRMERLQDITEEDAVAEGINRIEHGRSGYYYSAFKNEPDPKNWCHAVPAYKELWESINGPGSWERNDWVWVLEWRAKP